MSTQSSAQIADYGYTGSVSECSRICLTSNTSSKSRQGRLGLQILYHIFKGDELQKENEGGIRKVETEVEKLAE
jgi:hypothetical protein